MDQTILQHVVANPETVGAGLVSGAGPGLVPKLLNVGGMELGAQAGLPMSQSTQENAQQ